MHIVWGRQQIDLDIPANKMIPLLRAAMPTAHANPVQAMRDALDHPVDYPALTRALTPDDHVAVIVDERIPELPRLLVALMEHLRQAHIQPEAITLICMPPSSGQPWLDELPDEFQDVCIEVHQPGDRKQLAYLATTKKGRRVYLNRSAVDADQLVILTRRAYDPIVGYSGAETALFPYLSDQATIDELCSTPHARAPDQPWPIQREAKDIAWLLGAPFLVQVIVGPGDSISAILAGPHESSVVGERTLNERWRVTVDRPADVVIATITGDPATVTIDDLARAYFAAMRVVKPGRRIVLLTEANPPLGASVALFRQHEDPGLALRALTRDCTRDFTTGFMWATAATQAQLYLLSGMPIDVAEELFTIPMRKAEEMRSLVSTDADWLILPDAHRTLAVVR